MKQVVSVDVSKLLGLTMKEAASKLGVSHHTFRHIWRTQGHGKWPGKRIRKVSKHKYTQPKRVIDHAKELDELAPPTLLMIALDQ